MSGSVKTTLTRARNNLGVVEGPNNKNPYAPIAGHANNQPWCASFVVAVGRREGLKFGNESAYTPSLFNSMKQVPSPRAGDLFFIYFPSKKRIAHVGFVESVRPDGRIVTIEGNTDAKGGRTGGKVMRHVRSLTNLKFARPDYKPDPIVPKRRPADPVLRQGAQGQKVLNVQRALNKHGVKVKEDSDFGPGTTAAVKSFQAKVKIKADGVVGQSTWDALRRPKS